MPALPVLADIKTYLGITTTAQDSLLSSLRDAAIASVEGDTSRTIASGSNQSTTYSTDGSSSLVVHDRPFIDASRVVTFDGVTYVEGQNIWFLPDRRDSNISTTVQLRYYDRTRPDWYKADPMWWDKNLDNPRYTVGSAIPNNLVITGILGMPFPDAQVCWAVTYKWAALYWEAKSSASGTVTSPTGTPTDLEGESQRYARFVTDWTIRTAVTGI